jgi:hypothetical protein
MFSGSIFAFSEELFTIKIANELKASVYEFASFFS